MTSRQDVVDVALSFNGYLDGAGYDVANEFSADLGRPPEAYCADFVTDVFKRAGLPLPSMSPNTRTGYAYCPHALAAAKAKAAVISSWQPQGADVALFDWNGDGLADHTELVTGWAAGVLSTIGGNSGPSNVDAHRGTGGVHKHNWSAPAGQGNPLILAVIDMSHFVTFGAPAHRTQPGAPPASPASGRRVLMEKTPLMSGTPIPDVQHALQHFLGADAVTVDGVYGEQTVAAIRTFQALAHISVDGICGRDTYLKLGL